MCACLTVPWDANEAEMSLSLVHYLPERGWYQTPKSMYIIHESRLYAWPKYDRLRQRFAYFLSATDVRTALLGIIGKDEERLLWHLWRLCDHQAYVCLYVFLSTLPVCFWRKYTEQMWQVMRQVNSFLRQREWTRFPLLRPSEILFDLFIRLIKVLLHLLANQ